MKNLFQSGIRSGLNGRVTGLLVLFLMFPIKALDAWGPEGHRIVAIIAQDRLSPNTREIIRKEFNIKNLADVANWADVIKKRDPKPDLKHYANIAEDAWTYNQMRDCPEKKCVTEKIREFEIILADKNRPHPARKEAFKFLVHLVADIHQPMHLGNREDRGGNEIDVMFRGEHTNLHALWDSGLIFLEGNSLVQYAEILDARTTETEIRDWIKSYVVDWSNESRALVLKYGYPLARTEEAELTREYIERGRSVIEEQLRKAGIRLAHILNRSLQGSEL